MKINILGSGGFKTTPQPTCLCEVCVAARTDRKLSRSGPSFYLQDFDILIDTPTESKCQLDKLGHLPKNIIFSHWHPDHTEGYRVLESYKTAPDVYVQTESKVLDRVPGIQFLEKIEKIKLLDWVKDQKIKNENHSISLIKINEETPVYAFLISDGKKQALICPDHAKHLLNIDHNIKIDLLIMNIGDMNDYSGRVTTFDDNINIINKLQPKRTVLTHVEEHFCITEEKRKQLELKYKQYSLEIASDNQEVEV